MGVLSRTPAPIDCDRPASADFLRVLAAWAVGAFHIWQQSWYSRPAAEHWLRAGSVGVDFLVMLSAFCLFLPWANAAAQGRPLPQTRPAEFYRRRAARLLPAYYASLLFSLALAVYRSGWSRALAVDLFTHLTLTQQLFPACYIGTQLNAVSWTLTVFALFYLVFPLLAPLCARHPLPVLGVLCGVQLVYSLWALPQYGGYAYPRLFNQFPAFCGVLAVGMAAALVFARLARGGWTQHFLLLRGLAALTYSFYLWHQMLTVFLKYDLHLPAWQGVTPPNQLGDKVWMHRADMLYWAAALTTGAAAYFLLEKPAASALHQIAQKMRAEKAR